MTMNHILKKDHLLPLLRRLAKEYRLVAPIRNPHGDTHYAEVEQVDALDLDLDHQPQESLKPFFFPQQETIATYTALSPEAYTIAPHSAFTPATLYFGVRSCDLAAILYMDVVFSQGVREVHYLARRHNSLLVGLNCNAPFPNCFCDATKNGPFREMGADLQLTDLGDRFLVEAGRAQGAAILARWPQFFGAAGEEESRKQYQLYLEARGGFQRQVHVDSAIRRLAEGKVDEAVWQQLSLRCQDCAGCAYVCPTCTCFTIMDRPQSATAGERLRSWDACTFAGFTRMAGGHNPVVQRSAAIKNRFLHKLKHDVEKHGRPSCVGCGRCLGICFGGTDMARFVELASGE
ncbi:MAG: 4Fe-4S dicluster domain-containing protein [Thermodesulfobacteriota bacterium]